MCTVVLSTVTFVPVFHRAICLPSARSQTSLVSDAEMVP